MTEWISYSVAPGIRYCFNIGLEGYSYYLIKDEQFGPFADWFPAWLQNLLGNVVTFDALYKKVKEASDTENWEDALFWYGRFASIVFEFEPLQDDNIEIEFDSDTAQPWWLEDNNADYSKDVPWRGSRMNTGLRQGHQHPVVGTWVEDTYGFIAGFLNVTFGESSPNSTVCMTNISRVVEVSLDFYKHIIVISNDSWLNASENFQQIFETVHPIFFSCYQSGLEYFDVALQYGETFMDWRNPVYNLIHNIGYLYDATEYLINHHIAHEDMLALEDDDVKS